MMDEKEKKAAWKFISMADWMRDRLVDAEDMAEFYAGTPHNLETDCYDRGPAKRFLKAMEAGPKMRPIDA